MVHTNALDRKAGGRSMSAPMRISRAFGWHSQYRILFDCFRTEQLRGTARQIC